MVDDFDDDANISGELFDTSVSSETDKLNDEAAPECSKVNGTEANGKSPEPSRQICPICNAELPNQLLAINHHIDECLKRYDLLHWLCYDQDPVKT